MRNHFHLVLETPQPNLVFGMKWLLGEKGIPNDSEAGRKQYALLMEKRRAEEGAADYEELRRDWVLGSEEFRRELLAAVEGQVGAHHYGAERQETGAQKAERIVREELKRLGWPEDELPGRPHWHLHKFPLSPRGTSGERAGERGI